MKQTKQDRRSRRTRQLLQDALVALLREKRYDAITVQDILDRADVGRSTFYAHFYDKDDLLVSGVQSMLEGLSRWSDEQGATPLLPSLLLFQHVQAHRELYQALKRAGQLDLLIATFQSFLAADVERRLHRLLPPDARPAVPLDAAAVSIVSIFLALLRWWLEVAPEHTPEQLDAMFRALALPGLAAACGIDHCAPLL